MRLAPCWPVALSVRGFAPDAPGLASRRTGKPRAAICSLGFGDGEFAEVKDRGGKHRAGAAVANALDEMIERADAARRNDRNRNGTR